MESKLLVGGKNIVDHTNEQQRMLEQKRQEIAEQVDQTSKYRTILLTPFFILLGAVPMFIERCILCILMCAGCVVCQPDYTKLLNR